MSEDRETASLLVCGIVTNLETLFKTCMHSRFQFSLNKFVSTEINDLQVISRHTFEETFAKDNTPENIAQYLKENLSLDRLLDEVTNPCSEFYFVKLNNKVIGYLKLNADENGTTLEIERIYVLQNFHGQGVGQLLLDKAIAIAKNKNIHLIWLGVWERNPRAIRFYEKNGCVPYGSHVFKLGNDEQRDVLMRLTI
jgi:ribosomal protein S18 acetylase RimI-like enzyme